MDPNPSTPPATGDEAVSGPTVGEPTEAGAPFPEATDRPEAGAFPEATDAGDLALDGDTADPDAVNVGDLIAAPDGRVGVVLGVHRGVDRPDDADDSWQRPLMVGWLNTDGAWTAPDAGLVKYEAPTGQED